MDIYISSQVITTQIDYNTLTLCVITTRSHYALLQVFNTFRIFSCYLNSTTANFEIWTELLTSMASFWFASRIQYYYTCIKTLECDMSIDLSQVCFFCLPQA